MRVITQCMGNYITEVINLGEIERGEVERRRNNSHDIFKISLSNAKVSHCANMNIVDVCLLLYNILFVTEKVSTQYLKKLSTGEMN